MFFVKAVVRFIEFDRRRWVNVNNVSSHMKGFYRRKPSMEEKSTDNVVESP